MCVCACVCVSVRVSVRVSFVHLTLRVGGSIVLRCHCCARTVSDDASAALLGNVKLSADLFAMASDAVDAHEAHDGTLGRRRPCDGRCAELAQVRIGGAPSAPSPEKH